MRCALWIGRLNYVVRKVMQGIKAKLRFAFANAWPIMNNASVAAYQRVCASSGRAGASDLYAY